MKVRALISAVAGLGLLIGFQNCAGPTSLESGGELSQPSEKASLSGRYKVSDYIATSKCPDMDAQDLVCAATYEEKAAQADQVVEFQENGAVIIEGVCNTYYADYTLSGSGHLSEIEVTNVSGTSNACSGLEAEEESLLVFRLSESVRAVAESGSEITIYTDKSSAIRIKKSL